MRNGSLILIAGVLMAMAQTDAAWALPPFKKAFDAKYVTPANDQAFTQAANTASCNICHVKGEKKDVRNAYGQALAKLIPGNAKLRIEKAGKAGADEKAAETKKVMEELEAAFTKTEADKSAAGSTYGELLQQHKLPVQ